MSNQKEKIQVCVRWFDAYFEEFECSEVRAGNAYLWMRLTDGRNRQIPLTNVRWFSQTPESHSTCEDNAKYYAEQAESWEFGKSEQLNCKEER